MDVIDNILLIAEPNDLLALYLTDGNIKKRLNNKLILDKLSKKYNVSGTNFLTLFKNINISIINKEHPHTLYLYQQELTHFKVLKPTITQTDRINLLSWLYNQNLGNKYVFGLGVTLLDNYKKYTKENACACMYIASFLLNEYNDPKLFYKASNITAKKLKQLQINIINTNINLIQPSTVFFNKSKLCILTYFSNELLKYRPSLIAEAVNYITTNRFKIYTLSEIAGPCRIIQKLINMKELNSGLKKIANAFKNKTLCAAENNIINQLIKNKKTKWHIDDFKTLDYIGGGAEGEVYQVKHKNDQMYALKLIKTNENAFIEIASMQLLKHKYIVDLLQYKIDSKINKTKLYMEYGHYSLTKGITDGLLKEPLEVYFGQLIRGLQYCHFNDIIHRDLKPDNVVYNGEHLILIDFGLSASYASLKGYLDPNLQASELFRSPECLLGSTAYGAKSDIWGLGLLFYFMVKKHYFNNSLANIFKILGTPTNYSWPKHTELPKWRPYKKTPSKLPQLRKQLGKYYKYIKPCLVLNPKRRTNTAKLLKI